MPSHEIHLRAVLWAGAAIAATIAAVVVAVALLLRHWQLAPAADRVPAAAAVQAPAEPRLQSAPQVDLAAYREGKERALQALGWTDAEHAFARIPVQDAMELLLQRGGAAR